MKTFTALCLTIVLVAIASVSYAQFPCPVYGTPPPTAEGQEFMLCFMANEQLTMQDSQYQDIYIASLGRPAKVEIICPVLGINKTFDLGVFDAMTYRVSNDIAREQGALIYINETIDSSCIYVRSSEPIICYGMNHKNFTADAFIALPRHTADQHHLIMSYPNSAFTNSFSDRPSEFAVAAWEDNTIVKIKLADVSSSEASGTIEFTLDQFEAVQIQTESITALRDMTGSVITSDKPVAVYGGHMRAEVPVGYQQPGLNSTSRDHLCEQLPPTTRWGTKFVMSSFFRLNENVNPDLLRVLVRDDDTRVMINGTEVATLNAGQHFDTLITGPVLVETSNFALVAMLAHTVATLQGTGDPFMAIIPATEQLDNSFSFFISEDPVYTDQHVLIFSERSGVKNGIFLDGILLPELVFKEIPGSIGGQEFSYADIVLSGGVHRVRTNNPPEKGLTVVAYGWGEVDSYGYTAAARLRPTNGIIAGDPPKIGMAPGARPEAKVYLRNVHNQRIYFDKATIELDDAYRSFDVQLKKNIALDTRFIEPGVNMGLDLVVTPPNVEPIRGTMKVEYHSSRYRNLVPVTVPFVIEPQEVSAGVSEASSDAFAVNVFPNPVHGISATVSVAVEKMGQVSVRLLDATGREMFRRVHERVAVGIDEVTLDTRSLPAGVYTCEIALPAQGQTVRKQVVIVK